MCKNAEEVGNFPVIPAILDVISSLLMTNTESIISPHNGSIATSASLQKRGVQINLRYSVREKPGWRHGGQAITNKAIIKVNKDVRYQTILIITNRRQATQKRAVARVEHTRTVNQILVWFVPHSPRRRCRLGIRD